MSQLSQQEIQLRTERDDSQPREVSILEVIQAASADPKTDVDKLGKLLEMQERFERREAEKAFNAAMTRLQAKVPRIVRTRKIEVKGALRSKYAALEDIDRVVRPLMIEEGLSASYSTETRGKETDVVCTIRHILGHKESFKVTIPYDQSEYRSGAQCQGSTISFGQRRALCLAINIVTVGEDDDGQQSSFITEQQADTLADLIQQARKQGESFDEVRSKFLSHMKAKTVGEIFARDYQRAVKVLQDRAKGGA